MTTATSTPTPLGFLGLGLMGSRMAKNLAAKGFAVRGWNRSAKRAQGLGLTLAATPAELGAYADVLVTCVADPAALAEVAQGPQGFLATAKKGALWIDCSTIGPDDARAFEAAAKAKGLDFVEAPVTGSKNGAEKGTLVLMVGASDQAFARASKVFAAVGEKAIHVGPVGAGSQVKLAGNVLIAAMLQAFSEGLLLTRKAGASPEKLIEVIQSSGFRSPYFDFKGKAMLARDFDQHFSVDLMHKDLGLFLDSAAKHKVPTPAAASLREIYNLARSAGKGQLDISGVITAFEDLCGTRL
ncbi:MAG: NAD(P)-dependent oxidoreductase [Myxococcaceae bacterium]|nr:NAD(P)-dependent oxidoreductase [Myxococcaceae bacterium]